MTAEFSTLQLELVAANQILLHKKVLDAFGHVSFRHPSRPDRFVLARALPPSVVRIEDLIEFDCDGCAPVVPTTAALYGERFIHGAIYRTRPDVQAICHHHAPAIMPFCISDRALVPVSQTGASMGAQVPVWDSAEEFGATNLLVTDSHQAESLASKLGEGWVVLMRRHGACVVGRNLRELVFRAVFTCQDADAQARAALLGALTPLSTEEQRLASQLRPASIDRCWQHWSNQLPDGDARMNAAITRP